MDRSRSGVIAPFVGDSAIVVVAIMPDDTIVAARILDDFVKPAIQFVRFRAFTIECGDRFLVPV